MKDSDESLDGVDVEKRESTRSSKVIWSYRSKKDGKEPQNSRSASQASKFSISYRDNSSNNGTGTLLDEEASVEFSVDPDMYKKLNMKKPQKHDEQSASDMDKILQFQLKKDIERLIEVKGSFRDRRKRYFEMRSADPQFLKIINIPVHKTGMHGDFREVIELSRETSWRSTSKPYGEIAHKRYLEYLANLPKGPTQEEIIAKQQKANDNELWEKIKFGRTDMTMKQRREHARQRELKNAVEFYKENKVDIHRQERLRQAALDQNRFDKLRVLPTEREHFKSMQDWNRGVAFPYDLESEWLPHVRRDDLLLVQPACSGIANKSDRKKHSQLSTEQRRQGLSSGKYTGSSSVEKDFWDYMAGVKLDAGLRAIEQAGAASDGRTALKPVEEVTDGIPFGESNLSADDEDDEVFRMNKMEEFNSFQSSSGFLCSPLFHYFQSLRIVPVGYDSSNRNKISADATRSSSQQRKMRLKEAEEEIVRINRAVQATREELLQLERSLRPDPSKLLRGLVSKERIRSHMMAQRRLRGLESQAAAVLELKRSQLDQIKASLSSDRSSQYAADMERKERPKERDAGSAAANAAARALGIATYANMREPKSLEKVQRAVEQRLLEKSRKRTLADIENRLFCVREEKQRNVDGPKPVGDDFVLAASSGRYKEVIDMLYHRFYPINVHTPSSDGMTATFAVLRTILMDSTRSAAGTRDGAEAGPGSKGGQDRDRTPEQGDMDKDELFGDLLGDSFDRMIAQVSRYFFTLLGRDMRRAHRGKRMSDMDLVLQLLLREGGRLDDKHGEYDTDKLCVLHLAAAAGAVGLPMMEWLLDAGVDVNSKSEWGKTVMMISVERNCLPAVVLLLRRGTMKHIDDVDSKGNTALHFAALWASVEIVQLLLACDASRSIRNADGLSAEQLALQRGRSAVAVVLETYQAPHGEFRHRMIFLMQQFRAQEAYGGPAVDLNGDELSFEEEVAEDSEGEGSPIDVEYGEEEDSQEEEDGN